MDSSPSDAAHVAGAASEVMHMAIEAQFLTFGYLLRQYRLEASLTQEALADKAGISRRGIADLERGARRAPYRDTVQRLVKALGLSGEDAAHLEAAVSRAHGRLVVIEPRRPDARDGAAVLPRLPTPLTPLLGREREVTALTALLRRDDVRLVTITGPGGIGKTRLSLQVATEVREEFADGVWYIRLSRLSDPELVIPTIAHTLHVREQGAAPLAEMLQRHLQDRKVLLLLDNFEQVVKATVAVGTLLEQCAGAKVLVTSRIALKLRGEQRYTLRPLTMPDPKHHLPPQQLARYSAVMLFMERAQAVRAESVVTGEAVSVMAEICARLDGLPLAIELAAAQTRLLPPEALLTRLQRTLLVLSGGARDLDKRQQTMRSTLAWSHGLLTPNERRLLRRLAVFVGGWTLEAAEAICGAPEGATPLNLDLLNGLGSLVDQSLVQQGEEEGGEARFGMLHVIREYATEQLETSGEHEALRRAHAAYYERQAAEWRARIAALPDAAREFAGQATHAWVEAERENIRAALGWAVQQGDPERGLSIARTLQTFWMRRGLFAEGRQWLEQLLALPPPAGAEGDDPATTERYMRLREHRAYGYFSAGVLVDEQGGAANLAHSAALLEESARQFRDLGNLSMMADALLNLASPVADLGDVDRADAILQECLRIRDQLGQNGALERSLLSQLAWQRGDLERARALALEALRLIEHAGRAWERSVFAIWTLVLVALRRGDASEATAWVRDALRRAAEPEPNIMRIKPTLELLCMVDALAARHTRVAFVQGALAVPVERIGVLWEDELADAVAQARAALGEAAWQSAFAAGRMLSLVEMAAEVLRANE